MNPATSISGEPRFSSGCIVLAILLLGSCITEAFSLLGPPPDWMTPELGYCRPEYGGPMNIHEGYRWNVPLISYGFERSFLDYFGSNGVAAIESAISLLNALPPASAIDLQAYPLNCHKVNLYAADLLLLDLKSEALPLLLRHLGLNDPGESVFIVRGMENRGTNSWVAYVTQRNFDPETGQPSSFVNGNLFTYEVITGYCGGQGLGMWSYPVDAFGVRESAAADWPGMYGELITGLSRDDVGGIRFLLSSSRLRWENLLADVVPVTSNQPPLVRGAVRPGVEKITFVRHPTGRLTGEFLPLTNRWTDVFLTADEIHYQEVQRITARPDIVFSASSMHIFPVDEATGPTNWLNNSEMNGNPGGDGPGVIQPPVVLSFSTAQPLFSNVPWNNDEAGAAKDIGWASFDLSTNIVFYPSLQAVAHPTEVTLRVQVLSGTRDLRWKLYTPAYGKFLLQTSTNLLQWENLRTITNSGAQVLEQFAARTEENQRFFRIRPENP